MCSGGRDDVLLRWDSMSDSLPAGPPYSVDSLGTRPLTQAFHTVSGTGEPGSQLIVDLQGSSWGTLDPLIGTPDFVFGGEYRAPQARQGSTADQVVTVGDDGTWSLDLGEVPDGQYWIVVQDLEGRSPGVTAELQVWSSPTDRMQQNPDESLLATGPPRTPPAPSGRLENEEFAVDAQADPDLTQSFHTVSGTGRPGTQIFVDVSATGGGAPGAGAAASRGGAREHVATVADDGTWTIDTGELPDGEFQIDVSLGAERLHTETQTIRVWSSPGHRIEQQRAHGDYVSPERPTNYIAPDGTIFPETEPPLHQGVPAPKSESDILSRVDVPFQNVFVALQDHVGNIPLAVVVRTDTLARIEVPVQLSGDTFTPVSSIEDMAAGAVDALIVSIELGAEQYKPVSIEFIGIDMPPDFDAFQSTFQSTFGPPLTGLPLDETDPDELWGENDTLELDLVGLESDLVPGVTIATNDAPRIVHWFDDVEETGQGASAMPDDAAAPFAGFRLLAESVGDSVAGSVPAEPPGAFAFGAMATASTGTEGWEASVQPVTMTTSLEPSLTETPFITGFNTVATSNIVAAPPRGRRRDVLVGGGLVIIVLAVGTFLFWPGGGTEVVTDDPAVLVDSDDGSSVSDGDDASSAVDSGSVSDGDDASSAVDSGSVGEDDAPPVPPGLDPRAHVVSAVPVVTANGTYGIIVTFSQPLDGVPELFSYFVSVDFIAGPCSSTSGGEIHDSTITSFGPTLLLPDGSMFAETGCPVEPGATVTIGGQSGSWVEGSEPAFFEFGPDEVATDSAPIDLSQAVPLFDDGRPPVPPGLEGFEIAGASNNGGGRIAISFAGPVKALVEGDAHIVDIRAEASEGGIRVVATLRNIGGELIPNGNTINDADEVDGTIDGKRVDTMWEWPTDNQIVVTMVSTEGVAIPTSEPTVTVTVMETGSTDEFTFAR